MKKLLVLAISALIIASGMLTGCSNNGKNQGGEVINQGGEVINQGGEVINEGDKGIKRLTDCLSLTKDVDSMEVNSTSISKVNEQSSTSKTNMKFEGIKNGMKSLVTVETSGQTIEYYVALDNGKAKMYMKDQSGKYSVNEINQDQVGNMDTKKSINAYIDVIENNSDMVSKIDKDTYELNIPKEKSSEIYSKILGQDITMSFDTLKIGFVIGGDGYLKNMTLKAKIESDSIDVEVNTDYFNYNKKFNIVLPEV